MFPRPSALTPSCLTGRHLTGRHLTGRHLAGRDLTGPYFIGLFLSVVWLTLLTLAPAAVAAEPRILLVATSHSTVPDSDRTTGLWLSELVDPYWVFRDAGAKVDIATIAGGAPPIDPRSGKEADLADAFRNDQTARAAFDQARPLADIATESYDAIFLAGGHGTMWDFVDNAAMTERVNQMFRDGKVVAAVCHGPAGLLGATDASGQPIVAGRKVTGFTDVEELVAGWSGLVPFSLEERLKQLGGDVTAALPFRAHAVRDGTLVTGQNPASSERAARLVLAALAERAASTN